MLGVGRDGPLGPSRAVALASGSEVAGGGTVAPMTERDAWIALACAPGIGPVSFARLVQHFGDARAVLERSVAAGGLAAIATASIPEGDDRPTLQPPAILAIQAVARDPWPVLRRARALELRIVTLGDPAYPVRLRAIDLPPPVLFVRGDVASLEPRDAVAIVGTRRPTDGGRRTAARIATAVAGMDATIVSGLALGIDGAAHAAAVAADAAHRRGHRRRARAPVPAAAPAARGAHRRGRRGDRQRVRPGHGAHARDVPAPQPAHQRSRDSTVVVEAGARSGALTTAAWALEQGRRLFLVPGPIDAPERRRLPRVPPGARAGGADRRRASRSCWRTWSSSGGQGRAVRRARPAPPGGCTRERRVTPGRTALLAELGDDRAARSWKGSSRATCAPMRWSRPRVCRSARSSARSPRSSCAGSWRTRTGATSRSAPLAGATAPRMRGRGRRHAARAGSVPGEVARASSAPVLPCRPTSGAPRPIASPSAPVGSGVVACPAVTRAPAEERRLRKVLAVVLAVPVVAFVYLATAAHRTFAGRALVALAGGATIGLGVVALVPPRPDRPPRRPRSIRPLPQVARSRTALAHRCRPSLAGHHPVLDAHGRRLGGRRAARRAA